MEHFDKSRVSGQVGTLPSGILWLIMGGTEALALKHTFLPIYHGLYLFSVKLDTIGFI